MTYRRTLSALVAAFAVLPLAGCDSLLEVSDPDIVTPESLEGDIGLQTLRNGAVGEFTVAYAGGGSTDAIIMAAGLITDEWLHSGTFTTRFQQEVRNIPDDNGTNQAMFRRLQQARNSLESTADRLAAAPDAATDTRVGEMLMYAGFTYLAFAENYCNGVPFSKQPESGDTEFGPPETGTQIFERAAARFNSALGAAISSDDANAARVGLGRALLGLGRYSDAANAVNGVPADFAKFHRHSSNTAGQRNSIYELNVSVGRWSLGDSEGVNGLDFRTSGDPRITSALCPGCAFDTSEQVPGTPAVGDNWQLFNYTSRNDPVPLATGIEAWLIRAEAQLQASNPGGWLDLLNQARQAWGTVASTFRGDASGTLADLTDPGTAAGRTDLHFRERAFWLFAQGQRLGDLRRMVRQYGYAADQVFPVGPYWKPGATYGTDVNFPVPVDEENNPEFTGCLDRAP